MQPKIDVPRLPLAHHLKFRHFRVIETLNATGSMQAAAARLHVTAAAVSKSCLEAEALLGKPLFERSPKGLKPNQLCARVIAAGQRIHAELRSLDADLAETQDSLEGVVRIGYQRLGLHARLGRGIAEIKMMHPRLTIVMEFGMRANLIAGLEMNQHDLLLIDLLDIKFSSRYESKLLDIDQFFLIDPPNYLPMTTVLENWEHYINRIWIIPVPGMAVRTRFEALLTMRGLKLPTNVIETNSGMGFEELGGIMNAVGLATTALLPVDIRASVEVAGASFPDLCCEGGLVWLKGTNLSRCAQTVRELLIEKMMEDEIPDTDILPFHFRIWNKREGGL